MRMMLAQASLKTLTGDPSIKQIQRKMEQIANQFRREYDELQKERNQVVLTEGGARLQPMKDKIFLCNDDKEATRVEFGQLSTYHEEVVNEWR